MAGAEHSGSLAPGASPQGEAASGRVRFQAASLLGLPLRLVMGLLNRPMAWVQRRFGLGGMVAVFLAPNMLIFGVFVLVPVAINVAYSVTSGQAIFFDGRTYV